MTTPNLSEALNETPPSERIEKVRAKIYRIAKCTDSSCDFCKADIGLIEEALPAIIAAVQVVERQLASRPEHIGDANKMVGGRPDVEGLVERVAEAIYQTPTFHMDEPWQSTHTRTKMHYRAKAESALATIRQHFSPPPEQKDK